MDARVHASRSAVESPSSAATAYSRPIVVHARTGSSVQIATLTPRLNESANRVSPVARHRSNDDVAGERAFYSDAALFDPVEQARVRAGTDGMAESRQAGNFP